MKYLVGSKKEFKEFVNSITSKDKVAILTHTDLDGIASGIFMEEILKSKRLKLDLIEFIIYEKDMFIKVFSALKEKKINKVFLTDLTPSSDEKGYLNLKKNFDCFLIDHHPYEGDLTKLKQIILTTTPDCATLVIYNLVKEYLEMEKWNWLLYATMISEFSFNREDNLNFLIKNCSDINSREDIDNSKAFYFAKIIAAANIYYKSNFRKIFDFVKKKDLKSLEKPYKIVEFEMQKALDKYEKEAEFYPDKKIYLGNLEKTNLISPSHVATRISKKDWNKVYLVFYIPKNNPETIQINARHQGGKYDVAELLKKGIKGLQNAIAGGHKPAAGATIQKKDLEKFKENILK